MIEVKAIQKGEFEELNVKFISLLRGKQPANRKPVVVRAFSEDAMTFELTGRIVKVAKAEGKKPIIYNVVYEPDVVDTQEDFAKRDVIERAAHNALKGGILIDENHNFMPGKGSLVESFILNSTDDDRFPNVRKGSWVTAIEPSDEMVPYVDEIEGVSLAGTGTYKAAAAKPKVAMMRARSFSTTRARVTQ